MTAEKVKKEKAATAGVTEVMAGPQIDGVDCNYPNEPNARLLIYALQHIGYDNYVALCDIIDNSIDADADWIGVYISSVNKKLQIIVADNGDGMSLGVLNEALKLGSDTPRERSSNLGKYGMGLSTAGLSLANRTTVLTRALEDGQVLKSMTDVAAIQKANRFVKYLGEADERETVFFEGILGKDSTGTIVILEDCYGIKNRNITQFANKLRKEIARVFRKFMNRITFEVNDAIIEMHDPLFLNFSDKQKEKEMKSEVYSNEDYEVRWKDLETGEERSSSVHVNLVLLKEFGKEYSRQQGINMAGQGFSILRNNREIAFGVLPWFTKHNSMNRIRGEISFNSDMDEAMGVDFTKNGIDMVDSVDAVLRSALKPQINAMVAKIKVSEPLAEEEEENHTEAERVIDKKAHLLITPPARGSRKTAGGGGRKKTENGAGDRAGSGGQTGTAAPSVRFETYHSGRCGMIFNAYLEGKTTVIEWNVDHPFYERFVTSNRDNKTLVSSVDFLIYSLASAQILAAGDDDEKSAMVENIISIMSNNMRTLLS